MMRRLLYLVALLILASMPVKAQQQATQSLTITVGSGSAGGNQATQALTITVGPRQASQGFTMTVLHSVTVAWQAVTPGAGQYPIMGYNVFRSANIGAPYSQVNTTLVSGLQYTDPFLTSGTTYYYVVASVDSRGIQSPASSETSVTVPVP